MNAQGDTRSNFPIQISLLKILRNCLLFNLRFAAYRTYNGTVAGKVVFGIFLSLLALYFFCFNLDSVATFTFSSYTEEWSVLNVCWSAHTLGPAGSDSPLNPSKLLCSSELAG